MREGVLGLESPGQDSKEEDWGECGESGTRWPKEESVGRERERERGRLRYCFPLWGLTRSCHKVFCACAGSFC